jgi:hypothetical protein
MMSLLRITFGVLVGVGFFVGLGYLGQKFPTATPRVWCMIMGLGFGGLLAWFVRRCIRLGVTGGKFTRYVRAVSPFHFWFYIFFYSILGIFFLAVGACSILAPKILSLR